MKRIAIFPGSFDPFTVGHASIVERGLPLFDEIVIGVGVNENKRALYTAEERVEHIRQLYADEPRVRVVSYSDLTIDLAHREGAKFILRGLRSVKDFEYERDIASMNQRLGDGVALHRPQLSQHLLKRRSRTHRLRQRRDRLSTQEKIMTHREKTSHPHVPRALLRLHNGLRPETRRARH